MSYRDCRRSAGLIVLCIAGTTLGLSASAPPGRTAQAQSPQAPQQNPLDRARTAVETLINRLRGRDMPEGIVKTNGRIEATQVDVAAKYSGRLATVTVDEGDEVTAGQVVATISSPETEAQLRAAQAQVLKAKQALAEAIALIAQRKSDLDFARTDYERGKAAACSTGPSPSRRWISGATSSRRPRPRYVAAKPQRDQAEAAIKAAEADVERLQSILVDLVLVSPRSGRVQYRLARAGEVVSAGQRVLTILDLKDVYMTDLFVGGCGGHSSRSAMRRASSSIRSRNMSSPPLSASWRPRPSSRRRASRRPRSGRS